jgi:DNA-binding LacI/PurR family transcriptional regulator
LSASGDSTDASETAAAGGVEAAASDAGAGGVEVAASDAGAGGVDVAASDAGADAATGGGGAAAASGGAATASGGDDAREPRRRTAVMADVARLAGVSHQTVSRVINDNAHVRPETRRKVLAAMRTLDYRPNPAARALVTGRSRTLGVVSVDTTLYGPASTLFAIEQAAHAAGYFITIMSLLTMDRASVLGAVDRLRVQGVDGILVITPQEGAAQAVVNLPASVPVVAVEAGRPGSVPVVAVDQFAGAVSATQLLLDLGHRNVWHVAGPPDFLEAQQRVEGWRATLIAAGIEPPPVLSGDWSPRSGYQVGRRLAQDADVTAVFVANDQMALGVLRALHERGRSIPGETSIVGFDDIPEAQYFMPPLTTVRQDFGEMGRSSLRLLLELMQSERAHPPAQLTIAPELVVRRSTAPPPH